MANKDLEDLWRRKGTILATVEFLEDFITQYPEAWGNLELIIIRAEYILATGIIEYQIVSPNFRVLEMGEMMPAYTIKLTRDDIGEVTACLEEIKH